MVDTMEGIAGPRPVRVAVFVDYWNFQLRLDQIESRRLGVPDGRFRVDWRALGVVLARKACEAVEVAHHVFEGVSIYTSFDPSTESLLGFLRRLPAPRPDSPSRGH